MSQDLLAEKLGYKAFTTIQKWESGITSPPMSKFKALSDLFGYDMHTMMHTDIEKEESARYSPRVGKFCSRQSDYYKQSI